MGFPSKLKNYNLHIDGQGFLGEIGEIQLPKLAKKVEQWRGAGMLSELDVELGLEKMEMECKFGGLVRSVLRQFGAIGVAGVGLRFNGAYQEDQQSGVTSAELVVRGMHVEVDPGSAKVGDNTEWSTKSTLSYLRWSINGRREVEIDIMNNVMIIDGFDRMAAIRAALGQ